MNVIVALLLAQSPGVVGTVPVPNAELDAAHACLSTGTERLLRENRPEPSAQARWGWVLELVAGCEAEVNAAADSKEAIGFFGDFSHGSGITRRNMLRAEASYFVDRLIRVHFEGEAR